MKNKLTKISVFFALAFLFIGSIAFVKAQAQEGVVAPEDQIVTISDTTFNKNPMPRTMHRGIYNGFSDMSIEKEMAGKFLPGAFMAIAGAGIVFLILSVLLFAFWVWMLVHAIKNDIDYKPVWILVLWFMNILGAIVYYFAVKRDYVSYEDLEEVCVCENGKCVCGTVHTDELKDIKDQVENN